MLDLEAITLRHLTEDKMEGKTFHEGHIVIDLFNCVREVKAARTEAATMRAWAEESDAPTTNGAALATWVPCEDIEVCGGHRGEETK